MPSSTCPASDKIYPWITFSEASRMFPGLMRLCLGHVEDCKQYFVIDVYDAAAIPSAELELVCAVMQLRPRLCLTMLQKGAHDLRLCDLLNQLTPSLRSAQLYQEGRHNPERHCTAFYQREAV